MSPIIIERNQSRGVDTGPLTLAAITSFVVSVLAWTGTIGDKGTVMPVFFLALGIIFLFARRKAKSYAVATTLDDRGISFRRGFRPLVIPWDNISNVQLGKMRYKGISVPLIRIDLLDEQRMKNEMSVAQKLITRYDASIGLPEFPIYLSNNEPKLSEYLHIIHSQIRHANKKEEH